MKTIASALGSARPNVVAIIGLVRRLPDDLVLASVPLLSIGRPRWERLDEALALANRTPGGHELAERAWRLLVADPQFVTMQPQARFDSLANAIARAVQTTSVVNQTPQTIEDASGVWATWDRLRSGETRLRLSPNKDLSFRPDAIMFSD